MYDISSAQLWYHTVQEKYSSSWWHILYHWFIQVILQLQKFKYQYSPWSWRVSMTWTGWFSAFLTNGDRKYLSVLQNIHLREQILASKIYPLSCSSLTDLFFFFFFKETIWFAEIDWFNKTGLLPSTKSLPARAPNIIKSDYEGNHIYL